MTNHSTTWADIGINPQRQFGQQRTHCPQCGGRRKTLSIHADKGLYHCFRCGWSGRVGAESHWLDDYRERARKADIERDKARQRAVVKAQELWSCAAPAMWHPYLKRKRVLPLGIRQRNDRLVIPMYDVAGHLRNCQTIDADGNKRFLPGGTTKALYYLIPGTGSATYVCEGFATGAALHMYYAHHARVAVAFNCGNLFAVAAVMRERYPESPLVIAADNDQWTPGNPGLTKAREAADMFRAKVTYPTFEGFDVTGKPTDFNDLYLLQREARA